MVLFLYFYYSCTCSCSCLSIYLSICKLETKLFCETSSVFELENMKNAAIQRDFLNFWTWQRQKRKASFFLKLTTSKTKQFCDTSFKNGKLSAELTAGYQCFLRFFHSTCLKYCACHEKVRPGHTKCCTCHAKSFQQTWRSDAPKCNPSGSAQSLAPATRNDIWTFKTVPYPSFFFPFDLEMCFGPQWRALFRHLNFQKWSEHGVLCTFWLRNVLRATTACTFSTSQLPKVVWAWCVLYTLTCKCASCHKGVDFFDSATSKSAPELTCFVHFDFQMCFAPQPRAIFHFSSGQLAPRPPF